MPELKPNEGDRMLVRWGLNTRRGSMALAMAVTAAVFATFCLLSLNGGAAAVTPSAGSVPGAGTGTTISTRSTSLGLIVVGKSHRTVYLFTRDTSKTSTCNSTCRQTWLPVKTNGAPQAGVGIKQGHLSQNGKHQVTYYGHPLYYYAGDNKTAGKTNGQGIRAFQGRWWVVSPQGKPGTGATITMHSTADGSAVASATNDHTLYMLTTESSTHFACTSSDGCTATWPPLITTGKPHAGTGTSASLLSTSVRGNGSRQVTYNGHPLYYFAGDHAAGDDNGQCFDENPGTWYMLKASGAANKKQNGVTCSTTTPTNTTSGPPPVQCTPHPGDGIVSTATKGSNGEVLVDSKGCTLYLFRLDTTTASQCHGTAIHTCGYDWPPMLTSGGTSAQGNAQSGLLGTASRTDPAGTQVTYNGHPLYYYYTDNTPTTANGQNHNIYGGYWYVVTAAGDPHCPGTCH